MEKMRSQVVDLMEAVSDHCEKIRVLSEVIDAEAELLMKHPETYGTGKALVSLSGIIADYACEDMKQLDSMVDALVHDTAAEND